MAELAVVPWIGLWSDILAQGLLPRTPSHPNPHGRFVLLDRDGVLNIEGDPFVLTPSQLELLPGAADAVARMNNAGIGVVVVTNQSCIGRGLIDRAALDAVHDRLQELLAERRGILMGIYVCPHTADEGCLCRKPRPGLLLDAAREYGFDLATTWLVGDAPRDLEAALAAGCRPALVRTGKGAQTELPDGVPEFPDLAAFANWIVA